LIATQTKFTSGKFASEKPHIAELFPDLSVWIPVAFTIIAYIVDEALRFYQPSEYLF
jgi:hypothetical protein